MGKMQTEALWQAAQQAFAANDMLKARGLCDQILKRDRRHYNAMLLLGQVHVAGNALKEAAAITQRAATVRPRAAQAHVMLGEILVNQGRHDEAVARYEKLLRFEPDNLHALAGKADAYEKAGRSDEAGAVLHAVVAAGRETPQMAVVLARLDLRSGHYDAVRERVARHLDRPDVQGFLHWLLCFALGQACERAGDYDEAFAAYARGNTSVPAHFDAPGFDGMIDELIGACTPERLARVPRASHDTSLPIFVIGMPRCGSTLVETILDAHPDVAGAGEFGAIHDLVASMSIDIGSSLPYPACITDLDQADVNTMSRAYLQRLGAVAPHHGRIADKQLANYRHVGMLPVLFPQGRIVHCRRHPLDTCFSCFTQPFSPSQHPWSTDLDHIGRVYANYERLMAHWRDTVEIPMLEIHYEQLVADPEAQTRRLLEFCGLPWHDDCLRFHEKKRVVQTASYEQVTRPIYASSVERFRPFAKHLAPLRKWLAPA